MILETAIRPDVLCRLRVISKYSSGKVERLCERHSREWVEAANLETSRQQKIERESLSANGDTVIIIRVGVQTNPDGQYVASVDNPILSCKLGFGSTPYKALRELGKNIANNADNILQKIIEQEMEIRVADRAGQLQERIKQ